MKKLGKTGRFPEGKLNKDDEGELFFGITHNKNNIIIQFGTPVSWMTLDRDTALKLADTLKKHAEALNE